MKPGLAAAILIAAITLIACGEGSESGGYYGDDYSIIMPQYGSISINRSERVNMF